VPAATAPPPGADGTISDNAVVLLDEIDKADPDVPNDLLEAFESRRFTVRETGFKIEALRDRRVLLMLTSNGERELPPAFLRRCVTLALPAPTEAFFTLIADKRFGANAARHTTIAAEVIRARAEAKKSGLRMPSTAEFLDAVQACEDLGIETATAAWKEITGSVLIKSDKL
jgi:MoxR-like ATPase